jgi:hypothetical protein
VRNEPNGLFPAGIRGAVVAMAVAGALAWVFRGFTVDDALVTARVAAHLANGQGYRFNTWGPPVDAVTPLGWAQLLAAFGVGTPIEMLARARMLGFGAWVVAAGLLGALGPAMWRGRVALVAMLAGSVTVAAWSSAGMETGVVTLLTTLALLEVAPAALAAGLAAAWRPELLPWAVTLAAGASVAAGTTSRERMRGLAMRLPLAVVPALGVALARKAWFGAFAPLSVIAKAPELGHGLYYAADALLGTGVALFLLAPRALAASDNRTRALALAVGAHFAAIALAGGDWMALYRLVVPVLPTAILAAARLVPHLTAPWLFGRALLFAIKPLWLVVAVAWPARDVLAHRLELIERGRPALREVRSVACLDVGWVGAATGSPLLDLAGITDPLVARLPGGHTSKRVSNGLFENRAVDAVVLLLAPGAAPAPRWQDSSFARAVENRVAQLPALEGFRIGATLPLGGTSQSYLVAFRPAHDHEGIPPPSGHE